MHFGSFTLTDTPPVYGTGCRNPQQFLREVLAEALLAEALGFNSVWVPEHHFGLCGCLSFDESRARFDEEMQLVRTAWTEAGFTFAGTFHQVREPLTVLPRPVPPHPPIYVACFSRPTVEMAARSGFNAIFAPFAATMMFGSLLEAAAQCKALAREAGYPHSKVMCSYFFCLADSAAETLRETFRLRRPARMRRERAAAALRRRMDLVARGGEDAGRRRVHVPEQHRLDAARQQADGTSLC